MFLRKAVNISMTRPSHAHMYSDQRESSIFVTVRNKYAFRRDVNVDSDGAHLTSFGKEFQAEEEAKENARSPSVVLLCAGLLRRGMVCVQERVLRMCYGFFCRMSVTYDCAVQL